MVPVRSRRRLAALLALGLSLGAAACGGGGEGATGTDAPVPSVERPGAVACPAGATVGMRCAEVAGSGAREELFVVEVAAPGGAAGPPVLYVGGAAGVATTADLPAWRQLARDLRRDVIVVERRAAESDSGPTACADVALRRFLDRTWPSDVLRELYEATVVPCAEAMASGPAVAAAGTASSVADAVAVVEAFELDAVAVLGAREGADAALALAEARPAVVEAVVLADPLAPPAERLVERSARADATIERWLSRCAEVASCGAAEDELRTLVAMARDALDVAPQTVPLAATGGRVPVRVNAPLLAPALAAGLEAGLADELEPALRAGVDNGDWSLVAQWRLQAADALQARWPAALAHLCADVAPRIDTAAWAARRDADLDHAEYYVLDGDVSLCPASATSNPSSSSTSAAVPVLVVAGELDPAAGGAGAAAFVPRDGGAPWAGVTVAWAGRGALAAGCARTATAAFLDAPAAVAPGVATCTDPAA